MTYDEAEALLERAYAEMAAATEDEAVCSRFFAVAPTEGNRIAMLKAEARWLHANAAKYAAWAARTLALITEPNRGRWATPGSKTGVKQVEAKPRAITTAQGDTEVEDDDNR